MTIGGGWCVTGWKHNAPAVKSRSGRGVERCRRRPTLPRPLGRSTIGAVGLNCRVRNGNGCGPYALVASKIGCRNDFGGMVDRGRNPQKSCCFALQLLLGSSQAARAIRTATLVVHCCTSTGGLSTGWSTPALQGAHGPGRVHLGRCFPLRCIQRLSRPTFATRRCSWRNNRDTSGSSDSVLSY